MTSDKEGLERKFEAKQRNRNKPGVVLCGSIEQLKSLAQMTPEIEKFYQTHWDEDILWDAFCRGKKKLLTTYLRMESKN